MWNYVQIPHLRLWGDELRPPCFPATIRKDLRISPAIFKLGCGPPNQTAAIGISHILLIIITPGLLFHKQSSQGQVTEINMISL